jgi:CTP:molybdopterin cytidylyltransferase MocA
MPTGAIVLAAGASTRMGEQKLLLPFSGTTVIAHIIRELHAAGAAAVHVVTGFEPERIRMALVRERVVFAHNPDYTRGMLSSIRAGLSSAPNDWTAALIALGDQPLMRASHAAALTAAHANDPDRILVPGHAGRRGHPLLLPRRYWREVLEQYDDVGLRGLLTTHAGAVQVVEFGTSDILSDMDTPEDYRRTLERKETPGE